MRLLIVEDDSDLLALLSKRLRAEGYVIDQTASGEEGLYLGTEYPVDLAIIDLGLPDLGGIELIQKLRERERRFPILVLTARDRWEDKVEALRQGADDYLVKPFHMEELLARCNALLRRSSGWASATIELGPYSLDTVSQRLVLDGEEIELTSYEYRLFEYLAMHAGEVLSKSALTEHMYDQDFERDSNVIEVFIGRLRRKLDPNNRYEPIETLRGRGYRFRRFENRDS